MIARIDTQQTSTTTSTPTYLTVVVGSGGRDAGAIGVRLRFALRRSRKLGLIELAGRLITINQPEGAAHDRKIGADTQLAEVQVILVVVTSLDVNNSCTTHEHSLRQSTVLLFGLNNFDGIVCEVVEQDTLARALRFYRALLHGFLEIHIEPQHPTVEAKPLVARVAAARALVVRWACWDRVALL
jgi:hypothetical protein